MDIYLPINREIRESIKVFQEKVNEIQESPSSADTTMTNTFSKNGTSGLGTFSHV
jgi:hypothetical protein